MNKSVFVFGQWLSVLLAVISSFWLFFGQLYIIQFALLAYVFGALANQRPKLPAWLVIGMATLASAVTIWMGYRTEMGFRGGNQYYGTPGRGTVILSLLDLALLMLTITLYINAVRRAKSPKF